MPVKLVDAAEPERRQAAVTDAQIRHQAACLATQREELHSAERRLAQQSITLLRQQRERMRLRSAIERLAADRDHWRSRADAAADRVQERDAAVARSSAAAAAAQRELATARARVEDLERRVEEAQLAAAERHCVVAALTAAIEGARRSTPRA